LKFPSLGISKNKFILAWVLHAGLFFGCTSPKQETQTSVSVEESGVILRDSVLKSFRTSPVSAQIHQWGNSFQPELVHDITATNHYLQLPNKGIAAANMGIYLSDLGYLIESKQDAEIQRYFDACFLLANEAGMKKQFSKVLELRFAEIISKDESLDKSTDALFKNAENTSQGEEFKKMHAAALTGYYIEELFHLIRFAQTHSTDAGDSVKETYLQSIRTIIGQKSQLGNLIGYLDHIKMKPEAMPVYQGLLRLQAEYQALDVEKMLSEKDAGTIWQNVHLQSIMNETVSIRGNITDF
jgi:hypothetical protein